MLLSFTWQFTNEKARTKLGKHHPEVKSLDEKSLEKY
ncbi:hypothetical protein SCG7086_CK_00020 [Chlamydiales bacterium SCGC AG-110-P3]|nr:hypothetical protein SCG7086_CK_00020 [Chlamydiales bacterium SCGC AG-110-P3]